MPQKQVVALPSKWVKERDLAFRPNNQVDCVITVTTTTFYGETQTYVPGGSTSTFSFYTAFTQATVTSTKSGWTVYAIATAEATPTESCHNVIAGMPAPTFTTTQDARCAPSAMVSAWNGHGLDWQNDTPLSGAHWTTTTDDASRCCQLCADQARCAASSWDIRTRVCKLEFPVDFASGALNCGQGLLAFAGVGPLRPMAPGTGLFVAELCGRVEFANAKPDDGS